MGKIFVTGGAGYIGSHTCVQLLNRGYEIVIADNLDNSNPEALNRIKKITGKSFSFYPCDVCDQEAMQTIFREHDISCVIHFAGYKAVGESTRMPMRYYENNLGSTMTLLKVMQEADVKNLIFSSSCTVYGNPHTVPVTEDFPRSAASPYGMTKLVIEHMLEDLYAADKSWNFALLRYFNPIGAHESGCMGEDPNGIPNNLAPYITQVAVGKLEKLRIFGSDYPTKDGTGVRDYIHVMDLADGHLAAIARLEENCGLVVYNLGTGVGYSVLDIHHAFEEAIGQKIPYEVVERRSGDIPEAYADPSLAQKELRWQARRGLKEMAEDSWRWQKTNPDGYRR